MAFLGLISGGVEVVYMASAFLFILGLKRLSGVKTARLGNLFATLAMALAVGATLFLLGAVSLWVLVGGLIVGAGVGAYLALRVQMTGMPELVAFFNGMGGAASACVALAEIVRFGRVISGAGTTVAASAELGSPEDGGAAFALAAVLSILIGSVTLSGSLVAWAKLAGKLKASRLGPLGSQGTNGLLAFAALLLCAWAGFLAAGGGSILAAHLLLAVAALLLGVGLVVPIGGADMPVVISLLNSYSGLAACATGFVLQNNLLIIAGSLVGASGLILTRIMCRAMNRSLANVLFGGFGETAALGEQEGYANVKSSTPEEAAQILDAARLVIVAPGYGMAVAQAQHKVRELGQLLEARGCEVRYAIHPVAGRMPGHMNVLLAEADVPYEKLYDLDHINSEFRNADVAIVLGANDVCNPAASKDPASPIAGMPVLDVWDARTVFVVKRSLSAGYAGIKNELFEMENTLMLFGDAKKVLEDLVAAVKEL
jgi:NAD(P) transhydrogenase subunit beta